MEEIFKINDVNYTCEFKLKNPDGQEVNFTKSAIRGMSIVDNIFEPFITGIIYIANPFDFIEDDYFIRGDGRDEFLIKFKPVDQKNKKEFFEKTFIITDEKNIVHEEHRTENIKMFSLVMKDSLKFTDTIPYNKTYSGNVGDILKNIFIELLGEDMVDSDNWESGDFYISYTPPLYYRYIDLVRYLLKYFYSKDDDIYVKGFISFDRETNKYRFDLLSKIFKNNKELELEAFSVGDLVNKLGFENENNPASSNAFVGEYIGNLHNLSYTSPQYDWVNNYFYNCLVIGYDKKMGQHKTFKLKFDDIKNKWKTVFVDSFRSVGGKPKSSIISNKSTIQKYKVYKFPFPAEIGAKIVESEIYNALTFYNLQITFTNIGNTIREAGKFIDIFSPRKDSKKLKSQEKVLGRWFVTEIHHIFYGDTYMNKIHATKTYIGPNSNVSEEVD